jgi:O-antigen biosynthesis alpha-1,3-rhamnosyltransferase
VLRVGFDGRVLASPAAGVRRYAYELFGALAALERELTVVAVGVPDRIEVPPNVERAPGALSLPTNAGWMLTGLPRAARQARLDLFHAPAYTSPIGGPRPLVLTIHDVSYERHPEWYPYRRDPFRRAFYRRSARAADRVITDSQFSKQEIIAAYGLKPEAVAVAPLAPADTFSPGPPLPLPAGIPSRYVLHVGDLHARRNLTMVAQAVAAARTRTPGLQELALVLAGVDRGEAEGLQEFASRASGNSPLILFTGLADEATLLSLYRSAAALVYPSRYEGFGLPVIEAMACGVPVIAARAASLPEVAGDAAVLLDPDDEVGWSLAIERVVEDDAYAAVLKEAGLRRAAGFSWQRTAEDTAREYRSVLNGTS